MLKRIGFHVIYATSEDPAHLGSELGWAGPTSRGWRSAAGARGPHDLVLQLEARVAITRVQLLAHQTLISERIELLVHDSAGTGGAPRTPSSPQYCATGWVGLAPPTSSPNADNAAQQGVDGAAKSRELRTASLPKIPATYLRLRLSEPYKCEENKHNQVALMGVNVFGIALDVEGAEVASPSLVETYSPYDDLAFIMYVDPEIAQIIRRLEEKKHEAILAERFEYARKLKAATAALCSGGRALGALQLHKRLAALAEQYERASRKRDAIATGRARLAQALRIDTLLEADGIDPANDEYSEEIAFTIDMLTKPSSNLSFDAPSPPTVMPPLSSKDSSVSCPASNTLTETDSHIARVETSSTFVNTIPKHNRNSLVMDENRHTYLNGVDDGVQQQQNTRVECSQNHSSFVDNDKNYRMNDICSNDVSDGSRITSPQLITNQTYNDGVFKKKLHDSNVSYSHISGSENDLIEGSGKIYFEEQVSSAFNSSGDVGFRNVSPQQQVRVGRGEHVEYTGGRLGAGDGSYFSSPANSVSPTNMQYNMEICRNGEASPVSRPVTAQPAHGPTVVRRRNKSAGPAPPPHHRSSYEAYEERLLPALRHSHTNEFLRGCQTEPTDPPKGRPKMGERDRKQAALPILIFGEELVEKFYSKHFAEKEEGLQNLKSLLSQLQSELRCFDNKPVGPGGPGGKAAPCTLSPNKTARAATLLLHRALRDPVHSVYSLAADTTRVFFTEFIQGRVNTAEITRCVEKLVPELLTRAGDPAPRVHSLAMHTLLSMADCPPVRSLNIIPAHLVRPLTAGTAPRLALSRLLMVEQLLLNHGIDKHSGLRARCVAELGAGGLTHGQGAVRRAAERLLLAAYCRAPRLVRAQLPPDDPVTRRNLIYRHLFEGFDRIDQRKQEELMGVSQSEDSQSERSSHKYQDDSNTLKMADSMKMSQMSTSDMSVSQMSASQMSMSQMSMSQSSMTASMNSSMSGSLYQPKSSMKKQTTKKYVTAVGFNGVKNDTEYPGYNKLRLDSAVSPKHQPKVNRTPQNPRNYVLEKNWQNSIMQNGNHCPQAANSTGKMHQDVQETKYKQYHNTQQVEYSRNIQRNDKQFFDAKINGDLKNVMNGSMTNLNNGHKNKIVARNLHSSIVFDNRTSYSDGENTTAVENGIKKMQTVDNDVVGSSTRLQSKDMLISPVGSLKRNKNTRNVIYRSKSGPNVSTCFNDENFDSFEDAQMEIETYECCKEEDCQDSQPGDGNSRSGSSTPKVCERGGQVEPETVCPFCLCDLPQEGALDAHYWRSCPLLGRCPSCRAPLQLRDLNAHLTGDCPHNNDYRLCGRCMEAVNIENYQRHVADNDCIESSEEYWKCPLCCVNIPADEESWRLHLTGAGQDGCPVNPRIASNKHSARPH